MFKDFFNSPGLFDGLINVLVQELRNSPIRPHLCDKKARLNIIDQLVHAIMEMCNEKNLVVHEFAQIMEFLRVVRVKLHKSKLSGPFLELQERDFIDYKLYLNGYHKKCYHHWRPEDIRRVGIQKGGFKGFNTGGLLWGESGCGKSGIMAYLTAWAHENNWANLTIPSCKEFVDVSHDLERMENGLYL